MKISKTIKLALYLLAASWVACGALYFFAGSQADDAQTAISQQKTPALMQLQAFGTDVDRHVGYIQSRAVKYFAGTPMGNLFNTEDLDAGPLKENADEFSEKRLQSLGEYLDDLFLARGEALNLMNEANTPETRRRLDAVMSTKIAVLHSDLNALLEQMTKAKQNEIAGLRASIETARSLQITSFGVGFALTLLLILIGLSSVAKQVQRPVAAMLRDMPQDKKLETPNNELGMVAAHVNRHLDAQAAAKETVEKFAGGQLEFTAEQTAKTGGLGEPLGNLRAYIQRLNEDKIVTETSLRNAEQNVKNLEREIKLSEEACEGRVSSILDGYAVCRLNLEGGVYETNANFRQLFGAKEKNLLNQKLGGLVNIQEAPDVFNEIWNEISAGRTWSGVFPAKFDKQEKWLAAVIFPGRDETKKITHYTVTAIDITDAQTASKSLEAELEELRAKAAEYEATEKATRQTVRKLEEERAQLRSELGRARDLEYRLVQQQTAYQELARNPDIKSGEIQNALRFVTETTVYTLDEERCGLWLFTQEDSMLQCLDMYERQPMTHRNSLALLREDVSELASKIQNIELVAAPDAKNDTRKDKLAKVYLEPMGVGAFMAAPIHLGSRAVGMLMVEHTGGKREWTMDEQNFLLAVSDIVSLALEQGSRIVMEEELRVTLEESQALDEELRQNAEEIEATNEEMRRTQIELRGQISALNNAAIVAETNLRGEITYANKEFLNTYQHPKNKIMGKTHAMLKSEEHDEAFFKDLWECITAGKVWRGEMKNKNKDGALLWVTTTITPVLGIDGKPFKYIAVSFDITRQKQQAHRIKEALQVALEQEEQLRYNTEALVQANEEMKATQLELSGTMSAINHSALVIETDNAGHIVSVNQRLLKISCYEEEEVLGQSYTMFKSGRQPDSIYQTMWRQINEGHIWRGELELCSKNDERFWALMTANPIMDDKWEPLKFILVMFDITEQKDQEFRLKKQQATLMEVNKHDDVREGNMKKAFKAIAQAGVDTLAVNRASIWLFIENGRKVRCTSVTDADNHEHAEGAILDTEMYPTYFRTLEKDRIIDATDAVNDSRTKELAFTLFKPHGISSVLDVAIYQGAKTVGIMSFEHKGDPREWMLDEQSFAASLADTVSAVLEQKERQLNTKLKQAYAQLEEANNEMLRQKQEIEETTKDLQQSIKYAKRIQNNILPSKDTLDRVLGKDNYFVVHRQKDSVGGDFYWFDLIDDKQVIVVADGTGHGVPGAFLTLIGYLLLNQIVTEKRITSPDEILYYLHLGVRTALKQEDEEARHTSRDGMDVAICTFDASSYKAYFAGANLPFYYYQDWEIREIKPTKKSIGGEQLEEERTFELHEVQLKSGDGVYMYTDGFVDQFGGPDDKRFSTKRFRDLVLRTQHESMSTQRAMLNMEWKEWKDDREQLDDVTVFGMRIV